MAKRLPKGRGRYTPAAGAAAKAIWWATGRKPVVLGKPSREAAQAALDSLGLPGDEIVAVGDHLREDIGLGKEMGARTGLITTGAATQEEIDAAPQDERPTKLLHDIAQLLDWIDELEKEPPQ